MRKKIKKLKASNPKEYWKLLNKGRDKKQHPFERLIQVFQKPE